MPWRGPSLVMCTITAHESSPEGDGGASRQVVESTGERLQRHSVPLQLSVRARQRAIRRRHSAVLSRAPNQENAAETAREPSRRPVLPSRSERSPRRSPRSSTTCCLAPATANGAHRAPSGALSPRSEASGGDVGARLLPPPIDLARDRPGGQPPAALGSPAEWEKLDEERSVG
jgi:hypothetical protein